MRTSLFPAIIAVAGLLASSSNAVMFSQPASERTLGSRSEQPEEPGRGPRRGGGRPDGIGFSVGAAMKALNRGYRQLREQVDNPARRDDNLRIIGEMQRATVAAKQQPVPEDLLSRAPDAEARERLSAAYRTDLIATLRVLLDLEEAVAAGKTEAATEKLSALIRLRDRSHDALGVNEDVDEAGSGDGPENPPPARPAGPGDPARRPPRGRD